MTSPTRLTRIDHGSCTGTKPSVSFVVPCYNYGRFVAKAIGSLLVQTFRELEIIVLDDASTDDTPRVLEEFAVDARVRVVRHQRNHGHIRTYNEGLSLAAGSYVGLLSADDYCLQSSAVARQVAVFQANPDVGLVYTAHMLLEDGGRRTMSVPWPQDYVRSNWDEFMHLVWSNYIPASGTLMRADLLRRLGTYEECLPHSADWDLWLRAATKCSVGYVAEPLYGYRIHKTNMSHNQISPSEATDELLVTLTRAFASLPDHAPDHVRALRRPALQHALLQSAWVDLFHRRRNRSLRGIMHAIRRQPTILLNLEMIGILQRLLLPIF